MANRTLTVSDKPAPRNPEEAFREQELHRRLLAREEDAAGDALHRYLPRLIRLLSHRFGGGPNLDTLEEFAFESVKSYVFAPEQYHSEKGSVLTYLLHDAGGNLKNHWKRQRRLVLESELAGGEFSMEDSVAEDAGDRKFWQEVMGDVDGLPPHVSMPEILRRVDTVLPSAQDREFLSIWLDDHRGFEAFVPLLGLEGHSRDEQVEAVSRVRDRIFRVLRRVGKGFGDGG